MLRLLNRRTAHAAAIGKLKQKQGQRIFAPDREAELLRSLFSLNKGPMSAEALRAIYHEIFSSSRACQRVIRIAYWGPETGSAWQLARWRFGASSAYIPVRNMAQVATLFRRKAVEAAVVPSSAYYQALLAKPEATGYGWVCGDFDLRGRSTHLKKFGAEFYFLLASEPPQPTESAKTVIWIIDPKKSRAPRGLKGIAKAFAARDVEVIGWREIKLSGSRGARHYQLELDGVPTREQLSEVFNSRKDLLYWKVLATYPETPCND